MRPGKTSVVVAGAGFFLFLIVAIVIPPAGIVGRFLPGEYARYDQGFIAGLWVFKIVLGAGCAAGLVFSSLIAGLFTRDGRGDGELNAGCFESKDWVIAGFLVLLALPFRVVGLDGSLTFDEVFLVRSLIAVDPLRIFLHPSGSAHALHSLLANVFVRIAGVSEWSVRFPAMVFGSLTPPLLYLAGKLYLSRRTGVIAAALLCFTPIHIWYSQEAKGNTALVFFVVLSWVMIALFAKKRRPVYGAGYLLSVVCLCLSHLSGIMFAVMQSLLFLLPAGWRVFSGGDGDFRRSVIGLSVLAIWIVAVVHAPIVPFLLGFAVSVTANEGPASLPALLVSVFTRFTTMDLGPGYAALYGIFIAMGAVRMACICRDRAVFFALPFVAGLLVTVFAGLFSHARYHMYFLPAMLVFMAFGADGIVGWLSDASRKPDVSTRDVSGAAATIVTALLALGYSIGLGGYYAEPKSNYRVIGEFIRAFSSRDVIYCVGADKRSYPDSGLMFYSDKFETDSTIRQALAQKPEGERVFVVVIDPTALAFGRPDLDKALRREGEIERYFHCLGELDQFRVRDSYIFSISAEKLKSFLK